MEVSLATHIPARTAQVAVVGLGYVGLPLAAEIAEAGFPVVGVDVDSGRVASVNEGRSYIDDVPSSRLGELVERGRLRADADSACLREANIVLICVPTPLTRSKEPDLSHVISAVRAVARVISPGSLVILESTTYPGTTAEVVRPMLEESGLHAGSDFYLAFSPERVDPGNWRFPIRDVPKIVGGLTPACADLARQFYETFIGRVVMVSSTTVAEMIKVYENVFRNVNIALVNELTLLCDRMGLNVWEIIEAAATKPYGFMPFYPGPGVGGHCIPVDPYYLAAKAREYDFHARFIELAATVNDSMPYYVVSRTTAALGTIGKPLRGAKTLIIGAAYKRDISDVRESPALKVIELLEKRGALIRYHDPHVPAISLPNPGETLHSVSLSTEELAAADVVIITTDHSGIDFERVAEVAHLVVDTRNVFKGNHRPHVVTL